MTLTKNDLFNLTSPQGMFTPDSIKEVTSYTGVTRTVYSKNVNGATISSDSLDRLELMVRNHRPLNNDGARFDYNNGTNFNND